MDEKRKQEVLTQIEEKSFTEEPDLPPYTDNVAPTKSYTPDVKVANTSIQAEAPPQFSAVGLSLSPMSPQTVSLRMHRYSKPLSRGDYVVEKSDGSTFLKASKRKWNYKRDLMDVNGSTVYKLGFDTWSILGTYYIANADGTRRAQLKGKWSFPKLKAALSFTNLDGQPMSLELRSTSWKCDRFEFKLGEQVAVYMAARDLGRQERKASGIGTTWDITLMPNIDPVMISACMIGLDEYLLITQQSAVGSAGSSASVAAAGAGA